jgi:HJR/Mrr/RecB family endonuclease
MVESHVTRFPGIFSHRPAQTAREALHWEATAEGLLFKAGSVQFGMATQLSSREAALLLDQLAGEDLASARPDGTLLEWEQIYELLRSRAYATSLPHLQLPQLIALTPRLVSRGSLTEPTFSIGIFGWLDPDGRDAHVDALRGAVVQLRDTLRLLSAPVLRLLIAIEEMEARTDAQRTPHDTRRRWGVVRRLAIDADAVLDDFLVRSIVVTPQKLDIQFRRAHVGDNSVVEIMPTFEGAPQRWLEFFDKVPSVGEHFNIPTQVGAVHVVLTEPVRAVLREIKRLPGRRVAGVRAEAFLRNPFAALGDAAAEVIDADQFAAAKQDANIRFERFRPIVEHDVTGFPAVVGIDIDSQDGETHRRTFETDDDIRRFVDGLRERLHAGLQLYAWQEFELELDGDARGHLEALQAALSERSKPSIVIHHDQVFDLSSYYDRVIGVGEAEPFISAYIVKKSDEEGWFQSNLLAVLKFRPQADQDDITFPITFEALPDIEQAIDRAKQRGADILQLAGCATPLPIAEVEIAVRAFKEALQSPPPVADKREVPENARPKRPTLLIKGNIANSDHVESRQERLAHNERRAMERPGSLKRSVRLRDHQVAGVARLQHLFNTSPEHCRGVLMADDMGLGKTLQLLTFIAWAMEQHPGLPPALIVAPVSLLQNWKDELSRFFEPDALSVLTAYGDVLSRLRVARDGIDADLKKDGLVRFLQPNWRGDAQVVLTTYETLRDLEFSFAQERWSIIVCDEAQKIKNPNAMVTRAAKKLNVRFRVACTGTPVENTLADLWCLFDFIQPGLLGALNTFGREYGRSIETGAGGASDRVQKLRALIEPQVIRRTKADVAKDLPIKIDVDPCKVAMSNEQRVLYVRAIELLNAAEPVDEKEGLHYLGVLQHLRLVCADPRHYGIETFVPEQLANYCRKAPKLDWLLKTLQTIKAKDEKALLFAEHRDIQRLLQHYIEEEFEFRPRIVNGDTSVSARLESNRQKLINAFQVEPGFGVIILSPLAIGFGVNIQAANHVIHYLRHWNPAKEDQATDRAYRIGQTRDVHVYCPLTIAPDFKTFDVKLDELLRRKRALAVDMLHGAGTLNASDFDLKEMFPDIETTFRSQPVTLDLIEQSAPSFFEAIAATLWQKQGYRCFLTQGSDAGVDVVGVRDRDGVLIQCKSSANAGRQLGWEAVRDVAAGTAVYEERFPTVRFRRIGITNQSFNKTAHERARAIRVELVEQEQLARLIKRFPITTLDVLAMHSAPRL